MRARCKRKEDRHDQASARKASPPIMAKEFATQDRLASEKTGRSDRTRRSALRVETDKAVYPIESSFAGVMGEWKTKSGRHRRYRQELGTILTGDASCCRPISNAAKSLARWKGKKL